MYAVAITVCISNSFTVVWSPEMFKESHKEVLQLMFCHVDGTAVMRLRAGEC